MAERQPITGIISPDTELSAGWGNGHERTAIRDIAVLNGSHPLSPVAAEMMRAHELWSDPSKRNRAENRMVRALAQYALSVNGMTPETAQTQTKLYESAYQQVHRSAMRREKPLTPEFAQTLYLDIMPVVLGANQTSDAFLNSASNNSVHQIVATAEVIMDAEKTAQEGGEFVIVSPTCSHYDTDLANEEGAYDRGLINELHVPQVQRALEPMKVISSALAKHGIRTRIIIPQVDPSDDPRLMLAMVPAAVWKHISNGEVAEMLLKTGTLSSQFHEIADTYLVDEDDTQFVTYSPHTLSDFGIDTSVMDVTMQLNSLFGEAYSQYARIINARFSSDIANPQTPWNDISFREARRFADFLQDDGGFTALSSEMVQNQGWDEERVRIFKEMLTSFAEPGWGGLIDTQRFYARESARRAESHADNWKRSFDMNSELTKLMTSDNFFPTLSSEERAAKATELLQNVAILANIGIGGRAIFNTTVYFSLGYQLGLIGREPNAAIMWPIQEATDRQALDAMNRGYRFSSGRQTTIPLIVPDKSRLQPLSRRDAA